jgi:hypothetical protein
MDNALTPFDINFIADCCRFAEQILTEQQVRKRWRLTDADWERLGSDEKLIEAIEIESVRRVRNGASAREKAQQVFVRTPTVLESILDDKSMSPRHRIEAAREIRAVAAAGPEAQTTAERFVITINLGEDRLLINKPIAVGRLDDNGEIINDTPTQKLLERNDSDGEPI